MSYRIEWETSGVLLNYTGAVSADELSQAAVDIFEDPRFEKLQYVISDFLSVEVFTINVPNVVFMTKSIKNAICKRSNLSIACVADQPAVRPLFRIHEWEMEGVAWESRLFHTVSEAREWLADLVK